MTRITRIPFAPVIIGVIILLLVGAAQWAGNTPTGEDALDSRTALTFLGPPSVPPDNRQTLDEHGFPIAADEKVELGKLLFYDNRLSGDAAISCASCHSDEFGWTDGGDLCRGYTGTSHWRNCQTIINSAYFSKLFWDGAAKSLEKQAVSAASGGVAGNGEKDMMEERLRQVPEYVDRFQTVFGTKWPNLADAWRAIAAFERTLVQPDTPFDRYMKGDTDALSEDALAGLELFEGKAACIQCHNGALLSDENFYNLGVPENPEFELDQSRQITFRYEQYAKGVTEDIYRHVKTDLGLYYLTKRRPDMGKFRTPSLRYLVYTAPYMHNGAFYTLDEVVEFYNAGGGEDQIGRSFDEGTKTPRLEPLGLTTEEQGQLIAFLESLSGEEIRIPPPVLPQYGIFSSTDTSEDE